MFEDKVTDDPLVRKTAVGLAAGRLAIGAAIWLAPDLAAKALGFDSIDAKALVLGRIAASRDLVLGAWQLSALDDRRELRHASLAVALADAGDALTFLLAAAGTDTRGAGFRGLAGAVPATLAGAWLVRRLGH